MNEWLYHHAPDYEARRAGLYFQKALFAQIKDNLKTCMTMICDQITVASKQVSRVYYSFSWNIQLILTFPKLGEVSGTSTNRI